jgi:hypothetical protein
MRITKLSWSKKRKNNLVNFYALEPDGRGKVEVLVPPFSWQSNNDAISQLNSERLRKNLPEYKGSLLHIILDMSSGRLYLPNMEEISFIKEDPKKSAMFDAIVLKIEKLVDFVPLANPIRGDPLSTLRVRRVGDFLSVANFIKRQVKNTDEFNKDIKLPVIEADLTLMPVTAKRLFGNPLAAKQAKWLFVDERMGIIEFKMRVGTGTQAKDWLVHSQKPPFILINLAKTAQTSDAEVEFCLVSAYKEYAATNRPDNPDSQLSPGVQSFKYLMYIGWSFKELSMVVLNVSKVTDFRDMIYKGSYLYNAAKMLKKEGYPDPSSNPYYYTFKIGQDFPLRFRPEIGTTVYDYSQQPEIFRIVYYDPKSSFITIKTPLYLSDEIIQKVLMSKSTIFVSQYDHHEKSIKTDESFDTLKQFSQESATAITSDIASVTNQRPSEIPIKERFLTDLVFERKRISDYPQAAEILKDLCVKLAKRPDKEARSNASKLKFDDLEVIVGPWMATIGVLAGYYNHKKLMATTGKNEVEPFPGFIVHPPCIMIDNVDYPSVGDRTHMIIHEYRHHINSQLWIDSPAYDVSPKANESEEERNERMVKYLRSTDERISHKSQFKYMLGIGMTKEQIIRHLMKGKPTVADVPVVKEYIQIINDAATEMQEELDEEDMLNKMRADIRVNEQDNDTDIDDEMFNPSDDIGSLYN